MFDRIYSFKGKHAQYVKDLVDEANIFNRYIDVYIIAPIIGKIYGRKGEIDNKEPTAKIFTDQLLKEKTLLEFVYRLIMITEEGEEKEGNQAIDRAFREKEYNNEYIFESYTLGGIEYLHEKLFDGNISEDEFLDGLINFIQEFNEDLKSRHSAEGIAEVIEKYS